MSEETLLDVVGKMFQHSFSMCQQEIHAIAKSKGWWDENRSDGELIALCHSELSEMLEGLRLGNPASDKIPEYSSAEEEAADVIIRLMDMAEARGWDIGGAVIAKIAYNRGRKYRHGGKLF